MEYTRGYIWEVLQCWTLIFKWKWLFISKPMRYSWNKTSSMHSVNANFGILLIIRFVYNLHAVNWSGEMDGIAIQYGADYPSNRVHYHLLCIRNILSRRLDNCAWSRHGEIPYIHYTLKKGMICIPENDQFRPRQIDKCHINCWLMCKCDIRANKPDAALLCMWPMVLYLFS